MNSRIVLALALLLTGSTLDTLAMQAKCEPPSSKDTVPKDFTIDARSGGKEGKTHYRERDFVRVIVKNKNPFLYRYRVTFREEQIRTDSVAAFLAFMGVPAWDKLTTEEEKQVETAESRIAPGAIQRTDVDQLCVGTEQELSTSEKNGWHLRELRKELQQRISNAQELFSAALGTIDYENTLKKLRDAEAECAELVRAAEAIRNLSVSIDFKGLSQAIDDFKKKAEDLRADARRFDSGRYPNKCVEERRARIANIREVADLSLEKVEPVLRSNLQKLVAAEKELEAQKESIRQVLNRDDAFFEQHLVGDFDNATRVTVTVERRSAQEEKAEYSTVAKHELRFDSGARFVLAGGLAFSPLDKREFARVQGIDEGGSVVSILGLQDDSSSRISPLLILHSRMWKPENGDVGVFLSLGATARNDNKGTDVEYLLGGSLSFLADTFFVTLGGYRGQVQELEGGLMLGQSLPMELAELPIRKDARWSFGWSITYKIY